MSNNLSILDVANVVKGRIIGNYFKGFVIDGTCSLDNYVSHKVTFIKSKKYAQKIGVLKGAIVLITEEYAYLSEQYPQNLFITVEDVTKSMINLQNLFYGTEIYTEEIRNYNIDHTITFGRGVSIGQNVYLGRRVSIGAGTRVMTNSILFDDVKIGKGTIIEPEVTIYRGCQIGDNCIIRSGARIGTDGFRFLQDMEHQTIYKMIHVGYVVIGNRVEIGCNSAICRSTFENNPTIISDDVKIDNLVHIGHNVTIGFRTVIAGTTGISGSTKIGDDVWIGAGVTVSNDLIIGNGARILLNAVVAYDIQDKEIVSGFYAMPHRQWKQVYQKLKEFGQE
jgi:UDP-3-O-[3-hydroxymyristoyl] glucosamine N-acyltransferase